MRDFTLYRHDMARSDSPQGWSLGRQEVAQAEAILAAVTEAAVEHKEMAAARRRHGGEDWGLGAMEG